MHRYDIADPESRVIWVDDTDTVLGEITRKKAHTEGLLHRIAVTFVVNAEGQILVTERAQDGHLDHSSAGHVDPGESYADTAKRELEEELGISDVELRRIGHGRSWDGAPFNSNHIFDVFMVHADVGHLNPDEVARVYWAEPRAVLDDMRVHPERYTGGFRVSLGVYLDSLATNP